MHEFKRTSENIFSKASNIYKIINHEYSKVYGELILKYSPTKYYLSWNSNLIDPTIIENNNTLSTWIGVDQKVVAVSQKEEIIFSIALNTPLLTLAIIQNGILILCETEAIIVNNTCSIKNIIDFPDITVNHSINENKLLIEFLDSSSSLYTL